MQLPSTSPQVIIAVLVGVAAVVDDLKRRHIANWIPVSALIAGVLWQMSRHGWMGLAYALGGTAVGFAVFLVFYLLGGMGGGDVKLMAGFGALLGAGQVVEAALWTAGVGGLISVGVLSVRTLRGFLGTAAPAGPGLVSRNDSIPYAPAIALGVWLSLIRKG